MAEKPVLHLAGSKDGVPTLEQLIALSKALSGRDPTAEEIERTRQIIAAHDERPIKP